jgi:hypothetical protein
MGFQNGNDNSGQAANVNARSRSAQSLKNIKSTEGKQTGAQDKRLGIKK